MAEFLKKIPVLGALGREGVTTSEGALFTALIGFVVAKGGDLNISGAVAVAGCALGLGLYAMARAGVKQKGE